MEVSYMDPRFTRSRKRESRRKNFFMRRPRAGSTPDGQSLAAGEGVQSRIETLDDALRGARSPLEDFEKDRDEAAS